jgi:cytochrome c553
MALPLPLAAQGASSAAIEYAQVVKDKPDTARGKVHFAVCAECHGDDGAGVADGSVPAIAGQHFRVIAKELVDYRHDKRWDAFMEHYADEHNLGEPQNLTDVAAYISALPPQQTSAPGDGEFLSQGRAVYEAQCVSCHGPGAQGDDRRRIPRLAGQHYAYLLRQLHDAVEGRRPNFSIAHVRLLSRLGRAELVGLADYLSRLKPG